MGLSFPAELRYADSHEYAGPSDDGLTVGISAFAVDQVDCMPCRVTLFGP